MDDRRKALSDYRLEQALETLEVAEKCLAEGYYKDAINRSYYAAFYAIRAVLSIEGVDFRRHKDVVGHFNQHYVKEGFFERELGKRVGRLKQLREKSDYNDFFIASRDQAEKQIETARELIGGVKSYLANLPAEGA